MVVEETEVPVLHTCPDSQWCAETFDSMPIMACMTIHSKKCSTGQDRCALVVSAQIILMCRGIIAGEVQERNCTYFPLLDMEDWAQILLDMRPNWNLIMSLYIQ